MPLPMIENQTETPSPASTSVMVPLKSHIYTPPIKHPVLMQVGKDEYWTQEISEDELKRFAERVEEELVFKELEGVVYLWLEIDPKEADYRRVYKSAACCAFDATEAYLKNLFGVNLHSSDRDWYKNHPLVVSNGVPDGVTFGVLQALVKPYGFGISEIMMMRGRGKKSDTLEWMEVLGINPQSMTSNLVTDDDYLANFAQLDPQSFAAMEEEVKRGGFRYVDDVRGPAVIFGATSNAGGGHASYLAPRQYSTTFQYALRYKRLDQIQYINDPTPLILDHDEKAEERKELNFWTTKYKGKTLTQWTGYGNYLFNQERSGYSGGYPGGTSGSNGGFSGSPDQKKAKGMPAYTAPKQKEKIARLEDEDAIPLEEAETKIAGFVELGARSGIKFVYKEDFELNPDLVNEIFNFTQTHAKRMGDHIKTDWKNMPCETVNLCNKGRSAKQLRRAMRKFTDEIGKYREGLVNFLLALDRATNDCERWIIYALVREVYL